MSEGIANVDVLEIEVTPEMIEAGVVVLCEADLEIRSMGSFDGGDGLRDHRMAVGRVLRAALRVHGAIRPKELETLGVA